MEGSAVIYRCGRCGVESPERTCFVFFKRYKDPSQNIQCVQCVNAQRQANGLGNGLAAMFALASPFLYMNLGWAGGRQVSLPVEIAAACLMYPTALIIHELAHAVTGWLVGLEIGGIAFGYGRTLWRFQLAGLQIQLNTWPLSGRVFLGSDTQHFLRARVWLTTLMGPLANVLLVWLAVAWGHRFAPLIGSPIVTAWIIVNALIALFNLVPTKTVDMGGNPHRSDGLALLQIPRVADAELRIYRTSALLVRALVRYEARDFVGAECWLQKVLLRVPDHQHAILTLAACKLELKDYAAGYALLKPLLDRGDLVLNVRMALGNNIGLALVLMNGGALTDAVESALADRLTLEVMTAFPCILSSRSIRASVLAATGRPEEALALLEYVNYSSATPLQKAMREVVRALALRKLDRTEEAEKAAALALRWSATVSSELQQLGIAPPSAETQLRLLGKPVPAYVTWLRGIPASVKETARQASENVSQPPALDAGNSILAKIAGGILALFGGGAGALFILAAFQIKTTEKDLGRAELIFLAVLLGVAAFCLNLGYRLVLNRPNRHGSLLSPGAWRAISVGFLIFTLALGRLIFVHWGEQGAPNPGVLLATLAFSAWCWMASRSRQPTRA